MTIFISSHICPPSCIRRYQYSSFNKQVSESPGKYINPLLAIIVHGLGIAMLNFQKSMKFRNHHLWKYSLHEFDITRYKDSLSHPPIWIFHNHRRQPYPNLHINHINWFIDSINHPPFRIFNKLIVRWMSNPVSLPNFCPIGWRKLLLNPLST